jgi:hypothetical protein
LSSAAFTYGNILLLYCNFNRDKLTSSITTSDTNKNENLDRDTSFLPDYILGRINLCIETFNVTVNSKPDKLHSSIVIISKNNHIKEIKEKLLAGGIPEQYLEYDTTSKTIESSLTKIFNRITKITNPPFIYFIGSVWQRDIFDSIVESKFKGYKVLFEGALDNRSFEVVQKEKIIEKPKKGTVYYKKKLTNKAIDALLNYIFPKK